MGAESQRPRCLADESRVVDASAGTAFDGGCCRAGRFQRRDEGARKLDGFYTTKIKDGRREINKATAAMRRVSVGGEEMLINESDKKSVDGVTGGASLSRFISTQKAEEHQEPAEFTKFTVRSRQAAQLSRQPIRFRAEVALATLMEERLSQHTSLATPMGRYQCKRVIC